MNPHYICLIFSIVLATTKHVEKCHPAMVVPVVGVVGVVGDVGVALVVVVVQFGGIVGIVGSSS